MRELRNAALEYAARGWHVVPLRTRAKQPLTKNGLHDATDDLVAVFGWWQPRPLSPSSPLLHNIGIVCHPSGLIVIDVDPRNGGDDSLVEAERRLGALPRTVEAQTGGGGWHYYFLHPGGALLGKLAPGLDIKDHGYVLAPPSLHPSGRQYEWSVDGHPDEVEVARLPVDWVEAIQVSKVTRLIDPARAVDPQASPDPLRRILAATYVTTLSGREPVRGYWQCPFHSAGAERTPSLSADGHIWACFGCGARDGKRCAGGNIYDFAGLLWDFALPLRGIDYMEVKGRLRRVFHV